MHHFNGLQQKEITIYKKSNKDSIKLRKCEKKNVRSDQKSLGFRVGHCHVQLTGV